MAKNQPIKTFGAVAKHCGVSETTVFKWRRQFDDFPKPGPRGYSKKAIDTFCKRNNLGPHRTIKPQQQSTDQATLHELRKQNLIEKTEREKIARTREQLELGKELGKLVLVSDVESFHRKLAATIVRTFETVPDQVDRDLPKSLKGTDRKKAVEAANRIVKDCLYVVREFMIDLKEALAKEG